MNNFKRFMETSIGTALLVIGYLLALIYVCLIWPLTLALVALSNCFRKLSAFQQMAAWGRERWRQWRNKTHYL